MHTRNRCGWTLRQGLASLLCLAAGLSLAAHGSDDTNRKEDKKLYLKGEASKYNRLLDKVSGNDQLLMSHYLLSVQHLDPSEDKNRVTIDAYTDEGRTTRASYFDTVWEIPDDATDVSPSTKRGSSISFTPSSPGVYTVTATEQKKDSDEKRVGTFTVYSAEPDIKFHPSCLMANAEGGITMQVGAKGVGEQGINVADSNVAKIWLLEADGTEYKEKTGALTTVYKALEDPNGKGFPRLSGTEYVKSVYINNRTNPLKDVSFEQRIDPERDGIVSGMKLHYVIENVRTKNDEGVVTNTTTLIPSKANALAVSWCFDNNYAVVQKRVGNRITTRKPTFVQGKSSAFKVEGKKTTGASLDLTDLVGFKESSGDEKDIARNLARREYDFRLEVASELKDDTWERGTADFRYQLQTEGAGVADIFVLGYPVQHGIQTTENKFGFEYDFLRNTDIRSSTVAETNAGLVKAAIKYFSLGSTVTGGVGTVLSLGSVAVISTPVGAGIGIASLVVGVLAYFVDEWALDYSGTAPVADAVVESWSGTKMADNLKPGITHLSPQGDLAGLHPNDIDGKVGMVVNSGLHVTTTVSAQSHIAADTHAKMEINVNSPYIWETNISWE